tara:strand:+ start:580 stop:1071 length:492 start_codon:yes stop_codon:yes gene_type:complete
MKKICIISDTHGYIDDIMVSYFKNCDEVWHAGDIGDLKICDKINKKSFLRAVHGNIDDYLIRSEYPEYIFFKCEELKVLMIHIGGYPRKYSKKGIELIKKYKPNIFICGHSHILKVINDKKMNLIHINPGAIGKSGFHKLRTMIILEIKNEKMFNMNVIEFIR